MKAFLGKHGDRVEAACSLVVAVVLLWAVAWAILPSESERVRMLRRAARHLDHCPTCRSGETATPP